MTRVRGAMFSRMVRRLRLSMRPSAPASTTTCMSAHLPPSTPAGTWVRQEAGAPCCAAALTSSSMSGDGAAGDPHRSPYDRSAFLKPSRCATVAAKQVTVMRVCLRVCARGSEQLKWGGGGGGGLGAKLQVEGFSNDLGRHVHHSRVCCCGRRCSRQRPHVHTYRCMDTGKSTQGAAASRAFLVSCGHAPWRKSPGS